MKMRSCAVEGPRVRIMELWLTEIKRKVQYRD